MLLTKPIHVAVLGSGGREHALALKIASSSLCKKVTLMSGNAGVQFQLPVRLYEKQIYKEASTKIKCKAWKFDDGFKVFKDSGIDLVVVGPDDLLALGVTDELIKEEIPVFGPTRASSRLEWSKRFAKEVMIESRIPTAKSFLIKSYSSDDETELKRAVHELGGSYPIVLKYDGLALGKGVQICLNENEAKEFLNEIFIQKKFKKENTVLAETFLEGHEVSFFAICDGKDYVMLDPICDHKRLNERNTGPNTGGMGAFSPVPWMSKDIAHVIGEKIFPPVLNLMSERKTPFVGLLYAGLMVSGDKFWVLEFNARFGDPETQCLLPRITSDIVPILWGAATGCLKKQLNEYPLRWDPQYSVNIVAASRGYPVLPELGFKIDFSEDSEVDQFQIYFSGVDKDLKSSGGRVFSVTALAKSLDEARLKVLKVLKEVNFNGMHYRKDIGSSFFDA